MSLRGLVGTDEAGEFVVPNDVRGLVSEEGWGAEVGVADKGGNPLAVWAAVEQECDEGRRVADDVCPHRRSASRAARIDSALTLTPVASTRALARAMTSATGGRATESMSMRRRYSWRDLPSRAARAASSSRTSSGTSLTVIATGMQRV